ELFTRVWKTLAGFIQAQAAVAFVDAFFIGLGLWALGVPLAFVLAVITFFAGFIPIIGAHRWCSGGCYRAGFQWSRQRAAGLGADFDCPAGRGQCAAASLAIQGYGLARSHRLAVCDRRLGAGGQIGRAHV